MCPAHEVNDCKSSWFLDKVCAAIGQYLVVSPRKTAADMTVEFYGLAFKPDIHDLRDSRDLRVGFESHSERANRRIMSMAAAA